MDSERLNKFGGKRIGERQVDELIGLARGLVADGDINQAEAAFLQKWLAASYPIAESPILGGLYKRVREMLSDGILDEEERSELLSTLRAVADDDFELGEAMKPTTLPLCRPTPSISFPGMRYCFTGTFNFGSRDFCHTAVTAKGAQPGSLTQKTNVLVIGSYVTESWKHSNYGNKIEQAADWRAKGLPISIVSEAHWVQHL